MIELIASATLDDSGPVHSYHGILLWMKTPMEPEVIWTCDDQHPSQQVAQGCAEQEAVRRQESHRDAERSGLTVADLQVGYDHNRSGTVPFYSGRLAIVAEGMPPDIVWECGHRHASSNAALTCAQYERDRRARLASEYVHVVPVDRLLQIFEEIRQWALQKAEKGDMGSVYYSAAVGLCTEVTRRWPDADWKSYASRFTVPAVPVTPAEGFSIPVIETPAAPFPPLVEEQRTGMDGIVLPSS